MSIAMLVFAGVAVAGATGAFFSDTETSTGNTFTAGAIDLTIDNHAWYNGNECAHDDIDDRYEWQGSEAYPVPGTECSGTWELSDLGDGHLFFELTDLKPGDWEEDTISIHVNDNDAWMCSTLTLTSDNENSVTEPESEEAAEDDPLGDDTDNDTWDGELASELNFIFWADDGDNVLEMDEHVILSGTPEDLKSNGVAVDRAGNEVSGGSSSPYFYGYAQRFPIADSTYSILGDPGTPVTGSDNPADAIYIGKAFCYGAITLDEVAAGNDNSPADDPGFDCNGQIVTNLTQTDGITADMEFYAVQSRNNDTFECNPQTDA